MCDTMSEITGFKGGGLSDHYKNQLVRYKIKRISGDPRRKMKWRLN